jgi:hypothetical protein
MTINPLGTSDAVDRNQPTYGVRAGHSHSVAPGWLRDRRLGRVSNRFGNHRPRRCRAPGRSRLRRQPTAVLVDGFIQLMPQQAKEDHHGFDSLCAVRGAQRSETRVRTATLRPTRTPHQWVDLREAWLRQPRRRLPHHWRDASIRGGSAYLRITHPGG